MLNFRLSLGVTGYNITVMVCDHFGTLENDTFLNIDIKID